LTVSPPAAYTPSHLRGLVALCAGRREGTRTIGQAGEIEHGGF
jgi:hypothetical protein